MKIKFSKIAFKLFSYLSDRTGGKPFFVKYKLLVGTFLLSSVHTSAQDSPKVIEDKKIWIKEQGPTCYIGTPPRLGTSPRLVKLTKKLVNQQNQPIEGVVVSIKGRENTFQSDKDGTVEVDMVYDYDVLVFSKLGYETKEIEVGQLLADRIIVLNADNSY